MSDPNPISHADGGTLPDGSQPTAEDLTWAPTTDLPRDLAGARRMYGEDAIPRRNR